MTNDEIKIAVAEARGWSSVTWSEANNAIIGCAPLDWQKREPISKLSTKWRVPDYTRDLNEMHEVILYLRKNGDQFQWLDFEKILFEVVWKRKPMVNEGSFYLGSGHSFDVTNATAAQRCEAFLKTIGKWKDSCTPRKD